MSKKNPRIGCILVSPLSLGGTETAIIDTYYGLKELGYDAELLAPYTTRDLDNANWQPAYKKHITEPLRASRVTHIEKQLAKFDYIILSMTLIPSNRLKEILFTSKHIGKWTVAKHWNSTFPSDEEFFEQAMSAPKYTGTAIEFWDGPLDAHEQVFEGLKTYKSMLPYAYNDSARASYTQLKDRPYDFLLMGRTEHKKGVVAFVQALEGLTRRTEEPFKARIAGKPMQMPGGLHIHMVRQRLEEHGWRVKAKYDKQSSPWVAVKNGSEIHFTGEYVGAEKWNILSSAKVFFNLTSPRSYGEHLEYTTFEAMNAGNLVVAGKGYASYHYTDDVAPKIKGVPYDVLVPVREGRTVYNNMDLDSYDTSYKPLVDIMAGLLEKMRTDIDGFDSTARSLMKDNHDMLARWHNPKIAGAVYMNALTGSDEDISDVVKRVNE